MRIKRIRVIHVIEDIESQGVQYSVHFDQEGFGWKVGVLEMIPGKDIERLGHFFFNSLNTPSVADAIEYADLAAALKVAVERKTVGDGN